MALNSSFIPSLLSVFGLAVTPEQCPIIKPQKYPECSNYLRRDFDFIIVGAGPAGCALANRLSEVAEWNVLLIEAGGYPTSASEVPAGTQYLLQTREDWAFVSEPLNYPTVFINNRVEIPQGRVLGGSSTINGLLDIPGQPYDYDLWADLVHNDLWNWSNVKPYFARTREYLHRTYPQARSNGRIKLEAAARELGIDVNGSTPFGFKDEPLNTIDNVRLSMAKAYLQPLNDKSNFCLVVDTMVNKLVIDPRTKLAVGVEIFNSIIIRAKREVIISAGPINSPKILMLSGIGPENHLRHFKIPVLKNLPVGRNLQDHNHVPLFHALEVGDQPSFNELLALYCKIGEILSQEGIVSFIGFFNTNHLNHTSTSQWYTTPRNVELLVTESYRHGNELFQRYLESGNYRPQYRKTFSAFNMRSGWIMTKITILHPKSRGTIRLRSQNPKVPPVVDLNYFDHPEDLETMLKGIDIYAKIKNTMSLKNNTWVDLKVRPCDTFRFMSKEYIQCYAKMFGTTTFHYAGTCKMGSDPINSVVDPFLRIHGIPNLRVCDSSIIPELMSGHPSVPAAMIGEKLADIIKHQHAYKNNANVYQ